MKELSSSVAAVQAEEPNGRGISESIVPAEILGTSGDCDGLWDLRMGWGHTEKRMRAGKDI